jgi:hypothetical protein
VQWKDIFLDIDEFQCVDVIFCLSRHHVCLVMGAEKGGALDAGMEAPERGSWVRGQSIHSMGPVWREVCDLAQRVNTTGKGVLSFHYCYIHDNYSLNMFFSSTG